MWPAHHDLVRCHEQGLLVCYLAPASSWGLPVNIRNNLGAVLGGAFGGAAGGAVGAFLSWALGTSLKSTAIAGAIGGMFGGAVTGALTVVDVIGFHVWVFTVAVQVHKPLIERLADLWRRWRRRAK